MRRVEQCERLIFMQVRIGAHFITNWESSPSVTCSVRAAPLTDSPAMVSGFGFIPKQV